jgi:putative transposase
LREAEVLLSKGSTVLEICRKIVIVEQIYYGWHNKYGSLSLYQAKRFKKVENENTHLKKLVADLSLDKVILKELAEGKY